jgi:hypothetical protein
MGKLALGDILVSTLSSWASSRFVAFCGLTVRHWASLELCTLWSWLSFLSSLRSAPFGDVLFMSKLALGSILVSTDAKEVTVRFLRKMPQLRLLPNVISFRCQRGCCAFSE